MGFFDKSSSKQSSTSKADTLGLNTQSNTAPVINISDTRSYHGKKSGIGSQGNETNISITQTDHGAIQAAAFVTSNANDNMTGLALASFDLSERFIEEQATLSRDFAGQSAELSRSVISHSERSTEIVNQALQDANEDGGNLRRMLYWGSSLALGLAGLVTVSRIVEARS